MIAPVAGATVNRAKTGLVEVVTVEYRFIPDRLVFRRDVAYRLHVVNRGHELHELTAPQFFKAIEIRNPEALNEEVTALVLQPGQQKDLYLAAHRTGHYDMRCADHDWAGMTAEIVVE